MTKTLVIKLPDDANGKRAICVQALWTMWRATKPQANLHVPPDQATIKNIEMAIDNILATGADVVCIVGLS
jgi:hypothetical protein